MSVRIPPTTGMLIASCERWQFANGMWHSFILWLIYSWYSKYSWWVTWATSGWSFPYSLDLEEIKRQSQRVMSCLKSVLKWKISTWLFASTLTHFEWISCSSLDHLLIMMVILSSSLWWISVCLSWSSCLEHPYSLFSLFLMIHIKKSFRKHDKTGAWFFAQNLSQKGFSWKTAKTIWWLHVLSVFSLIFMSSLSFLLFFLLLLWLISIYTFSSWQSGE